MSRSTVLLFFLVWLAPALTEAEPLVVFVSVSPQKTILERVGGGHVRVEALIRPGSNPHTYEPTPQQIAALSRANLFVRIGMPFEEAWMRRLQAVNPGMLVLDGREGLPERLVAAHDDDRSTDGHQDEDDELDPHVWTSPPLVEIMIGSIRDTLARLDPEHAADYAANHDAFAVELQALDRAIRAELAGSEGRRFLVYHPAWGYFADTYGLVQVAIEREGKEPGARSLAALIDQARRAGIRVVFVQAQLSPKAAEQVARAIGGRVEVLDPLSADFLDHLLQAARAIASASRP